MLMKIERSTINIMDNESKEIVERFPIRLVRDPTAFTSNDPKEVYNNILIYVVGHTSLDDPASSPAEMHIFQCVNVQARDLVEVLKSCSSISKTNNAGQKLWQDLKVDNFIPAYEDVDSDSNRGNKMTINQVKRLPNPSGNPIKYLAFHSLTLRTPAPSPATISMRRSRC